MCERVVMGDGSVVIVCLGHRRGRRKKCAYPQCSSPASVECDHRDSLGVTCDRATCRAHAKPIAKDVDWCWLCARAEAKRGNSPRLAL